MLSLLSRIVDPLVYILIGNNLLLVCTVRCLYYGIFSCELIDNPKLNGRNLSHSQKDLLKSTTIAKFRCEMGKMSPHLRSLQILYITCILHKLVSAETSCKTMKRH